MNDKLNLERIPRSKTYHEILTDNIATLTTLKAGEVSKRRLAGITKFQTLNILEEIDNPTNTPTESPICYGPPNNNTNSAKIKLTLVLIVMVK